MPSHRQRKHTIAVVLLGLATIATLVFLKRADIVAAVRLTLEFESLGRNAQGLSEYRHRKTGLVMVFIPGGTFQMGSSKSDRDARPNEHPRHEVALDPFLISKYEVSRRIWQKITAKNAAPGPEDDLPATEVSWDACDRFCAESGLRLPTEAEWEYAARARTATACCYGDAVPRGAAAVATGRSTPDEVTSGETNAFGLYQVHGNVAEWCADTYDFSFYSRPESTTRNPFSSGTSEWRVVRGGSFESEPVDTRSAFRARFRSAESHPVLGFRPAVSYYRDRSPTAQ